jgi:hypothetical protein
VDGVNNSSFPLRHSSLPRRPSFVIRHSSFVISAAFSLIEVLVTIALLTLIILGLFVMFAQVQKAFRGSMTQVDVLEAGRAAMEMLPREIEQIAPSNQRGVNFFTEVLNTEPLTQFLPGSSLFRTNVMEDFFMLKRDNRTWVGVGYFVRTNDINGLLWLPQTHAGSPGKAGAGTLYRFTTSTSDPYRDPLDLFTAFDNARRQGITRVTNVNRIADGVLHFKFRAYDTNGSLITTNIYRRSPNTFVTYPSSVLPNEVHLYSFFSNAVPAAIEMELGILEQANWQRFKAMQVADVQHNYLSNHAGQVHIFRQRIPIASVDPRAYQQ